MLRRDDLVLPCGKRDHDVFNTLETLAITRRSAPARGVLSVQPPKLDDADSGADFVEAVVESRLEHVVRMGVAPVAIPCKRGHAVGAEEPDPLSQLLIVGHHEAAFTSRQVLVGEKAEAADSA